MASAADEAVIARLASSQHGMVTTGQLIAAGIGARAIRRRVDGGWLARVHDGVYLVGLFPGPFGPEMAAQLACGKRAFVSHASAAAVHGLRRRPVAMVDISAVGGSTGRREGIRAHRASALSESEMTVVSGIRVTTPARTLLDVAASTSSAGLERLTEEAQVQKVVTRDELLAVLRRGAGRPGVAKLRAVVGPEDEPTFTRSEAERRLRRLIRAAGLPQARTNVRVAGWLVDAVWHRQRLVVEVDGYRFHRTRAKFERDRRMDGRLLMAGYRVLRVTWRQLTREPELVVAMIATALAAERS
jgi:very-short-patch-repair endonuclease/predicted transcriptional regulator of viral defense system